MLTQMKFYFFIFVALQFSLAFAASCPDGSNEWQNSCLFFHSNATGFALATSHCISLGGQLTSIHDGFTNIFITQQAQTIFHESTVTDFWIGLTDLVPSKNWIWVDNSTFDFNNWASDEPQDLTGNNCAAISLTTGLWNAQDCSKEKPYFCQFDKVDSETTTSSSTTTRSPFTPFPVQGEMDELPLIFYRHVPKAAKDQKRASSKFVSADVLDPVCYYSGMNIYLNYFFDTGGASGEIFTLYNDILTETSGQVGVGNPTRLLSIYAANANGSTPAAVAFTELQTLHNELIAIMSIPWFFSSTSSVTNDLTYYQSVLTRQLPSFATPVIVMFLSNPVDNVDASTAKMNAVKYANPNTYIIGVFLSSEPTISQLLFDYTLNLTAADDTAAHTAVKNIINFICAVTVSP